MKKIFLSFLVTLIGLTPLVYAQAPCFSAEECEALRKELVRPELSDREQSKINKSINKQLQILSKYWPQKDSVVNGVRWSNVLKGKFANNGIGSEVVNGVVQQSPATEACKLISGRLPSREEIVDLKDHWDDESLVPVKFKEKMNNKTFWSSTATSYAGVDAFFFDGSVGHVTMANRITPKHVRCILGLNPFVIRN